MQTKLDYVSSVITEDGNVPKVLKMQAIYVNVYSRKRNTTGIIPRIFQLLGQGQILFKPCSSYSQALLISLWRQEFQKSCSNSGGGFVLFGLGFFLPRKKKTPTLFTSLHLKLRTDFWYLIGRYGSKQSSQVLHQNNKATGNKEMKIHFLELHGNYGKYNEISVLQFKWKCVV